MVDGPQHYAKESKEYDKVRTKFLEGLEIKVIRFRNIEINTSLDAVIEKIKTYL